jgi:hypothetical protein
MVFLCISQCFCEDTSWTIPAYLSRPFTSRPAGPIHCRALLRPSTCADAIAADVIGSSRTDAGRFSTYSRRRIPAFLPRFYGIKAICVIAAPSCIHPNVRTRLVDAPRGYDSLYEREDLLNFLSQRTYTCLRSCMRACIHESCRGSDQILEILCSCIRRRLPIHSCMHVVHYPAPPRSCLVVHLLDSTPLCHNPSSDRRYKRHYIYI